jgi:hypothetical protein
VPISRAKLIKRLKKIGFGGPFPVRTTTIWFVEIILCAYRTIIEERSAQILSQRFFGKAQSLVMSGSQQISYPFVWQHIGCIIQPLKKAALSGCLAPPDTRPDRSPGPPGGKATRARAPMRAHARAHAWQTEMQSGRPGPRAMESGVQPEQQEKSNHDRAAAMHRFH